jgi:hypothetical protein
MEWRTTSFEGCVSEKLIVGIICMTEVGDGESATRKVSKTEQNKIKIRGAAYPNPTTGLRQVCGGVFF